MKIDGVYFDKKLIKKRLLFVKIGVVCCVVKEIRRKLLFVRIGEDFFDVKKMRRLLFEKIVV